MNTETIQFDETPVKRADALEVGEHVIEAPEHGKAAQPLRVVLAHPFSDGDGRRMVSLMLDSLDGREPMYVRARAEAMFEMADEQDLAAFREVGRRQALARALRQLAASIEDAALPIPRYQTTIGGVLDSRADLDRWAKHLDVEVRMSGDIPVVDKSVGGIDVHFQSAPEPVEPVQEWLFTFGAGQQFDGRFVRIAGTYDSARSRMNLVFGHAWCAQYDWRRFDEEGLPGRVAELPEAEWPAHAAEERTCAYPGDHEHDHEMCRDALAEQAGE